MKKSDSRIIVGRFGTGCKQEEVESQIPRLKQAIMVRWGGSRFSARFRVLRDDIFSDISLIAVVFARDSGIRTLPIRASGSYVHRAVRDPGGACPYAQVIRVQGRE